MNPDHVRLGPAEVAGVPFVPDGRVTRFGYRARGLIGRTHFALAPPPVQILEGLFGLLEYRALVVLCEHDIPDALDAPVKVADLAVRLDLDEQRLARLLRFAATRRWVRVDRRDRVHATRFIRFLRRDHPGGWRAWVEFAGGAEVTAAVNATSCREGIDDAFQRVNGAPFFEWMGGEPQRWATFDRAMAAGGRMHGLALSHALDWSSVTTVCDVGGGTGQVIATLLDTHPHLDGATFDLPAVVGRAVRHPRLTAIAGDAFSTVPSGYDRYILVNVLHDWNDTAAVTILQNTAASMSATSTLVVVENDPTTTYGDFTASIDMLMAALTVGGTERHPDHFDRLARKAGLRLVRRTRLASGDLAHTFCLDLMG